MHAGGAGQARRRVAPALALLALITALALALAGHSPVRADSQSTPTDPDFAPCESQTTTADITSQCNNNEQWNLYGALSTSCGGQPRPDGGLPCWAGLARDPQHAAGVNDTGAWAQGNVGRPDVLVAYIEGGVNYDSDNIKDGLDNIYLNKRELPYPQDSSGADHGAYDLNGDGHFDVRDYAQDPRVNPSCASGMAPFTNHQEGVTWSCVPGGQHQYLNAVHVAGQHTPYLSPEDLIAVFGHCQIANGQIGTGGCPAGGRFDNDGNGYPNDVSGWNFDRNTNDPQTEDTAYGHAPGLISDIAGEANNGYAGVGECRTCTVVPIKQGAECLGRPDHWGAAILYAADLGVTTISSVVVSYAYSSFNQKAIDYAYDHGVSLALDSNDFDSMDHTDGMLFNHVIPGNSLSFDQHGTGLQANATTWFRARSSTTSYGTHNVFSGYGTSTSGATPFMASMLGMVQSAGLNARDQGVIPSALRPDEVKQIMMDTASPVVPQTQSPHTARQWPGNPLSTTDATHSNWSSQYGYGRPDIGAATAAVMAGKLPPTAEIGSPNWFEYVDPKTTPSLAVYGKLAPSRVNSGGAVSWVLEYALGADPADASFHTIASGTAKGPLNGKLGTLDLGQIPPTFYEHPPLTTLQPDGSEQYSVSLRLRVVDANGLKGEDRRSVGLRHDPSLVDGAPKRYGAEISGAPTYSDIEGHHQLDLVFSTYDGDVHALRPSGKEAPGFPVHSDTIASFDPMAPENLSAPAYANHPDLRNQRDPLSGIAVGDLGHSGTLDVVATGMNGRVYAWDGRGRALPGFPQTMDTPPGQYAVPTPRSPTPHSRDPLRGAWASPVLAPLQGTGKLDIVIPGWDGMVYAWAPDGTRLPGWPVDIKLPQPDFDRDGVDPARYMRDPKLMYPVGVADVLGTGKPQVFVSSFECSGKSASTQDTALGLTPVGSNPASKAWLYGVWADGNDHPGGAYLPHWPAALPSLSFCYDQSIDFVGESVAPPTFANVDGSGLKIVSSAVTGNVEALNADGSVYKVLDQSCKSASCSAYPPYRPGDTHTLTLTGQGGFGDLLGTGTPQYIQSSTGLESILLALGQPGQAALPQVYEKAWDVRSGALLPSFPERQDGFPFYDAPITADVGAGGGTRNAIEANDDYFIHAWGPTGLEPPDFPKYTGQWTGFSGTVGEPRMNGQLQLVYGTREGELFQWRVSGDPALNNSWGHYRHDERNTGQYGLDALRPATVQALSVTRAAGAGAVASFIAPGDSAMVGRAAAYQVRYSDRPITAENFDSARPVPGLAAPGPANAREHLRLAIPPTASYLAVRAVDRAGNLGAIVAAPIQRP